MLENIIVTAAAGHIHHVDHLDDRLNGNQAGNYTRDTLTGADEPVYPSTCVSNPAGHKQQTGRVKDKKGGANKTDHRKHVKYKS